MGHPYRQEVVSVIGGILSFLGLIVIIAIALVALVIGLVVRTIRGRPRNTL